ncbi:MAG: DeoR/GlpR family DNA-binding transcription regulator [Lachnospiraceae bacterium]
MKKNKATTRQNAIIEMLETKDMILIDEFCEAFCCSASTIRNDLNLLAEQGALTRIFGGAKRKAHEASKKTNVSTSDKDLEIAGYVVEHLIAPQSTIILDYGSSCVEIARLLAKENRAVSVLTFSLPIMEILSKAPAINLYSFGGAYDAKRQAFYDDYLKTHSNYLHADLFFMIANSVNPDAGFTVPCPDFPITERTLMEIATKTIALCDSANLTKSNYRIISDFTEISTMVTDSYADLDAVMRLKQAGLDVLIADQTER